MWPSLVAKSHQGMGSFNFILELLSCTVVEVYNLSFNTTVLIRRNWILTTKKKVENDISSQSYYNLSPFFSCFSDAWFFPQTSQNQNEISKSKLNLSAGAHFLDARWFALVKDSSVVDVSCGRWVQAKKRMMKVLKRLKLTKLIQCFVPSQRRTSAWMKWWV